MRVSREQNYPSPRPTLSFEEWLDFWAKAESFWDWFEDSDHFETRATYAEYSLWVLEQPASLLAGGLDTPSLGNLLSCMPRKSGDTRLPRDLRVAILKAERNVFVDIFAPLLRDVLRQQGERSEFPELADACFMWWDNCAFEDSEFASIFRTVCQELLTSSSAAVQEAALHGLGHHIGITGDADAVRLIDDFLRSERVGRRSLIEYAKAAKAGNVL